MTYLRQLILILLFITYFKIFCNLIVINDIISILGDQLGDHLTYYLTYFLAYFLSHFSVAFLLSLFHRHFRNFKFFLFSKTKAHAPASASTWGSIHFLSRYLTSPSQFHYTIYYTIFASNYTIFR